MKLSIIIVNYNTREVLRDCLRSIPRDEAPLEVIVADNASRDGSPEMVANDFPWVRLIARADNGGFSKANNDGIRIAQGEFVLLLNSDTVVRPGALSYMLEFLEATPQAGAVTCRLLNADGTVQACVSARPSPALLAYRLSGLARVFRNDRLRSFMARYLGWVLGKTLRGYLEPYKTDETPLEVGNISGACLMLRRAAVEQIGLLDESFFMYFEDMDYCIRLADAGWRMFYLPQKEIVHLVGVSSGGRMRDYSVHSYRSLFHLYRKHYSAPAFWAVRMLVLFSSAFRWLANAFRRLFSGTTRYRDNCDDLAQVIRMCFQ